MNRARYIVKKRMRQRGITEFVNLPYGTEVESVSGFICYQGNAICTVSSRNAHLYFSWDGDGHGKERGALTTAITSLLEKRDKEHQARWDKVWGDNTCRKYRRKDHEDHFLWSHAFYEAPVEDLRHIARLIGAKGV